MAQKIQFKRGTSATFYTLNPVLLKGEPALETDTNKIKFGDGVTAWRDLPYANPNVEVVDGGSLLAPPVPADPNLFSPPDVDGLMLWMDATHAGYIHASNGKVSMWEDMSQARSKFVQSLKTNRPSVANQIQDQDVVTFDGTNDAMIANIELPEHFTLVVAFMRRGLSTDGRLLTAVSEDGNDEFILCGTESGSSFGVNLGSGYEATQSVDDLVPVIYTLYCDASGCVTRLNGLEQKSAGVPPEAILSKLAIGSSRDDFSEGNFSGDIAEIVMYEGVVGPADLNDVENYMMARWGVVQVVHPLLEGMKAFWPLNEESGNRIDITDAEVSLTPTGTVGFEAGVIGNSADFTGGANYLQAPADFTLAGSFSVSLWFKPAAITGSVSQIIQNWAAGTQGQMVLGFGDEYNGEPGEVWAYIRTADDNYRVGAPLAESDRWYHVVLVFDQTGNKLLLYVDGVLADQAVTAGTLATTNIPLRVGVGEQTATPNTVAFLADQLGIWDRVLSAADVEMLYNDELGKEDFTADLYGDNVSLLLHMDKPANAVGGAGGGNADPYFNDVSLLLHFNGDNGSTTFTDSSKNALAVTVNGNVTIGTAQSKFGGASGSFDGVEGSYLSLPTNEPLLNLGAEDFTIEFWLYGTSTNWTRLVATGDGGGIFCGPTGFLIQSVDNRLNLSVNGIDAYASGITTQLLELQTWQHVAVTRAAGVFRVFVDGVLSYAIDNQLEYAIPPLLYIGQDQPGSCWREPLDGYIDDLRITKGVARYTANFTPPTAEFPDNSAPTDPYFDNVALLLRMDGSTFTDVSPLAHNVVAVGNATVSTAQSKFGGGSLALDGDGDWLVVQDASDIIYGNADFTLECWLYLTSYANSAGLVFGQRPDINSYGGVSFNITDTGAVKLAGTANAAGNAWQFPATDQDFGVTLPLNAWKHVALVRAGNTVTLYVDGVAAPNTTTLSEGIAAGSELAIGNGWALEPGGQEVAGYLDEVRITLGVARYTANFDPPTAEFPLGPIKTVTMPTVETSLLLHFDGANESTTFTNSGSLNMEFTRTGSAEISTTQSQFGGSSLYLNGSTYGVYNYLTAPYSDKFEFGTGDFTVEGWIYWNSATQGPLISIGAGFNGSGPWHVWALHPRADQSLVYWSRINEQGDVGVFYIEAPYTFSLNQWYHVAASRVNGVTRVFVNGVQIGSAVDGTNYSIVGGGNDNSLHIGYWYTGLGHQQHDGYIDEIRVIKGVGLYATNFTPPTAPFATPFATPAPDLLLHFNDANGSTTFTDQGKNQLTVTVNAATISTAQSKFGGSSGYFNGVDSYISVADNDNLNFSSSDDFCIEGWIYFNDVTDGAPLISKGTNTSSGGWTLYVYQNTFYFGRPFIDNIINATTTLTANTWYHVAVTRENGTLRMFLNGTQEASSANVAPFSAPTSPVLIGRSHSNSYLDGHVDEVRVVKGSAIYTANFTPPVAPFQNPIITITQPISGLADGLVAFYKLDDLTDSSGNGHTLTNYGATFTPGKIGNAATLNGYTYLRSSAPQPTTAVTLAAWVYLNSINGSQGALILDSVTGNNWGGGGVQLDINPDGTVVVNAAWGNEIANGSSPEAASTLTISNTALSLGQWYHIAGTFSVETFTWRIYINGVLDKEATFPPKVGPFGGTTANTFGIGTNSDGTWGIVDGKIDAAGIWGRALSAAEISALYNNGNGTETLTSSGGGTGPITTFIDSSKHNHALTAVGNAYLNLEDIKYGSGSGEFAGGHCTIPMSPEFAFGTGDFTVEFWGNLTYAANSAVFSIAPESEEAGTYLIGFRNDPNMFGFCYDMPNFTFVSADISTYYGEWAHYAFVRLDGVLKMYVNGTQVGTANTTIDLDGGTQTTAVIGRRWVDVDDHYLAGLIDDLRITKGAARYIANFNPPLKAFPDPVLVAPPAPVGDIYAENVTLLLHMDGANGSTTFTDNSYLQNTVTAEGNAAISTAQSKWGGASTYFDGNGDALVVAYNNLFDLGSSDFTIEGWVWLDSGSNSADREFLSGGNSFPGGWAAYVSGNGGTCGLSFAADNGAGWNGAVLQQAQIPENGWHHIAFVRAAGIITGFVDGVATGSTNIFSGALNANTADLRIGQTFYGYIDDFRITKGVARYTADFIPPTEAFPNPFTPGVDATLLMHFDGADGSTTFTDSSVNSLTPTVLGSASNVYISTTQSKFGGSAMRTVSNNNDQYGALRYQHPNIAFGEADFTVEMWFYCPSGSFGMLWDSNSSDCVGDGFMLFVNFENPATAISFRYVGCSGATYGEQAVTLDEWHHVAVSRQNGTLISFLDGVEFGTRPPAVVLTNDTATVGGIAAYGPTWAFFDGYIDELRVVKGKALYTSNFTPPTAPFTPTAAVTPTDITGCDLWLDSTGDIATVNGSIVTWSDKSGNGRTATPADYAPAPVVAAGDGPNGQDVVRFSGDPNVLDVSYQFNLKNSSGFILLKQPATINSGPAYPRILGFQPTTGFDSDANDGMALVFNNDVSTDGIELWSVNPICVHQTPLPIDWTLIAYTIDASGNATLRLDGVQVDTGENAAMTAKAAGNLYIGHGGGFTIADALQGDIAEISLFNHALGEAALIGLERGIMQRWFPAPPPPGNGETILLLHFDGPANTPTFVDSSPLSQVISAEIGTIITDTQAKFNQSVYFNGSPHRVYTNATATLDISGGAYTVEFWLYLNSVFPGDAARLFTFEGQNNGNRSGMLCYLEEGQTLYSLMMNRYGIPVGFGATGVVSANQWVHIALVYDGAIGSLYVDGVNTNATASHSDWSQQLFPTDVYSVSIGANTSPFSFYGLNGYIDEFRIVKGAAVYTGNFTPPTQPFGAANLLMHFDADTSDNSGNNVSVTNNGVTIDTITTKFGSGSAYFNGANVTTLTTPDLPAFGFGTGDFTIEMFVKQENAARNSVLSLGTYQDGILWRLTPNVTDSLYVGVSLPNGGYWDWDYTTSVPLNTWTHIALTRQNGTLRAFIDGVMVLEQAGVTVDLGTSRPLTIGCGAHELTPTDAYYGYIDELRIIKGEAVYTGNFTPPTAPFN